MVQNENDSEQYLTCFKHPYHITFENVEKKNNITVADFAFYSPSIRNIIPVPLASQNTF